MLDVVQAPESEATNVVQLGTRAILKPEEAPLTAEERALIRAMLAQHKELAAKLEAITGGCPMAQRILKD